MEHIEKALARAREMRGQSTGSRANQPNRSNAQPSINGVTPDYTETAVVKNDLRHIAEQRLVADDFRNPVADVYRLLRSQILQRMKKQSMTMLAVTGARAGDGSSTTAANLAISIALDVNQTVLLIDLNLRDPSLAKKFGLKPTVGIEDYLRGNAELKDCLVNPGLARLVVLPVREGKGEASEMIVSPRMTALARELHNRYSDRVIIFDTPPLLESGDTLGFLPNVHGVLFVARSGHTTKVEIDRAAGLLKSFPLIGTLLNAS